MSDRRPVLCVVSAYLALTWLVVVLHVGRLLREVQLDGALALAWALAALLTYSAAYLLPAAALAVPTALLVDRRWPASRAARAAALGLAALGAGVTQVALVFDVRIFQQHGFHLNGFVWNILRTPGGLASLGGGASSEASFLAVILGTLLFQAGLLAATAVAPRPPRPGRRAALGLVAAALVLALGERGVYALADLRDDRSIVTLAGTLPFYTPTTIRSLARKLGVEPRRPGGPSMRVEGRSALRYPRAPLAVAPAAPRWNVVWLVAESLRGDMVDPEIMPRTHAFARGALWCRNHQGGGNGTRMGMFTQLYGLYGAYWFAALAERRGPLLVDELLRRGYRFDVRTSASFTYPEFDQTLWANVPPAALHTRDDIALAVDRDEAQVTSLLEFLDRDPATPSFSFMFFECTHAAYSFRPQDVVRPDYLDELNYVFTDVPEQIQRIKSRYVNAAHCLDRQLGRVYDHLKAKGLLERTIVVVTGDHGEEFREHGRWGHNSAFSKEQISPPLVLWIPGATPAERRDLTSHLDVAPTLLRALGVTNPSGEVSLGHDLLGPERRRYNVVCDWYTVVWSDERTRAAFRLGDVRRAEVTVDDEPVADPAPFLAAHKDELLEVMAGLQAFRQPGSR